jgi:hypothetical protein
MAQQKVAAAMKLASADFLPCDAAIYNDFNSNWSAYPPSSPWFTCVSFINPHDMSYYPGFFPIVGVESPGPPGGQGIPYNPSLPVPTDTVDFVPSIAAWSVQVVTTGYQPPSFNYETTAELQGKSINQAGTAGDPNNFLQYYFQTDETDAYCDLPNGSTQPSPIPASDFSSFINWYYYMLSLADQQIGAVLADVVPGFSATGGNPSANTAIIFLSDHGEYAVSHGLHAKGGAVYEEALRVPLCVVLPSQQGAVQLNQMCSMVDVFRLVVELALGGSTYDWAGDSTYGDQAQNQSLLSFIQNNSAPETRAFTGYNGSHYAFILTTTDETYLDAQLWNGGNENIDCSLRSHVMCIRTKSYDDLANPATAFTGGKLAIYSKWMYSPPAYTVPIVEGRLSVGTDLIVQDYEYYDYENYQNRTELGNDYYNALNAIDAAGLPGSGVLAQQVLSNMAGAFGNLGIKMPGGFIQPASGIVANLLTRQLQGVYKGAYLYNVTADGIGAWYAWVKGTHELGSACGS